MFPHIIGHSYILILRGQKCRTSDKMIALLASNSNLVPVTALDSTEVIPELKTRKIL